jgi:hypothetical protein
MGAVNGYQFLLVCLPDFSETDPQAFCSPDVEGLPGRYSAHLTCQSLCLSDGGTARRPQNDQHNVWRIDPPAGAVTRVPEELGRFSL